MSKDDIAKKLNEFNEYLSISDIFSNIFRWIGWLFVKGLGWIVDQLEKLTDDILLVKTFFQNKEIVAFVDSIRPFLYILLAFSILYAGYMLIFQKKFNREGMVINLFIALTILALLGTGLDKVNTFTDKAIDTVKTNSLYPDSNGTLSNSIMKSNITDLVEFDKNNWDTMKIDASNSIAPDKITDINVKETYSKDLSSISDEGKDISKYFLSFNEQGDYISKKLDQSGLKWNNQYYFRYSINWFTIIATLSVIAFTLFSISFKLAKLFFELTFNYILAIIIAPVDIHDGQKTKKILQAIFNTFIATILIFISMKVYMIGTSYLEDTLSTFPYIIALIAFSVAVIDGPNIVERLFGIDAGLKSGLGLLAGAYAGSKMIGGTAKGAVNLGKSLSNQVKGGNVSQSDQSKGKPSPNVSEKPLSPNGTNEEVTKTNNGNMANGNSHETNKTKDLDNENNKPKNHKKAPSPNDKDNLTSNGNGTQSTSPSNSFRKNEETNGSKSTKKTRSQPESKQTQTSAPSINGSDQADTDNITENVSGNQNTTSQRDDNTRTTAVSPTSNADTSAPSNRSNQNNEPKRPKQYKIPQESSSQSLKGSKKNQ